jgi:hypothetical protein
MKLSDHVDKLRNLIELTFDKEFSRLGIGKKKNIEIEKLPEELRPKRVRFDEMLENHIGETGDYEHAREKLIDELTFTLFNRLAAIKVMEAAALFPPILTKQPEHGDRSFGHKAWLEINPHMREEELEGIREYLKTAFNELGETLPLYSRNYPYALLSDAISLNEIIDCFNEVEKDSQVGSDIWLSDDVLGWMYESYNNVKKKAHKDSGDKTEYNKVSLQSQVYTPLWVVQFLVENSLGKLYLEMYPDSEIKKRFKIANAPKTQERKPKPIHEVKIIDPACGSGNFLLYGFDFFYELYLDQIENYGADYDEKDIPKLIIENNIHGIDLDDRAVQLAQLGLYIKAKKKRRTIGDLAFNVVSSDFYLPEFEAVKHIFIDGNILDKNQQEFIANIWNDLQYAYKFGSLIQINERLKSKLKRLSDLVVDAEMANQMDMFASAEVDQHHDFATSFFSNLKTAIEQYAQTQGNTFLTSKTRDAITFLELLTTEYDVAIANPPYTSRRDYGPELKAFIDNNYRKPFDTYINLYSCFIQRLNQLLIKYGKLAMVTPMTFMFISTFEETRKLILTQYHINLFIQYGFGGMFSESVDPAMFVLEKGVAREESTFVKLDMYFTDSKKEIFTTALVDHINSAKNQHVYRLDQKRIFEIVSHPFIFWISQDFRNKFKESLLEESVKVCQGLATGQNERFLRFWWELSNDDSLINSEHWVSYAKGGAFNKWHGNLWLKINWKNNGYEIKNFYGDNGKLRSVIRNEQFYYQEGITYSASGRGGYAFRYLPFGNIFDVGGSSIFPVKSYKNFKYLLAFLNSKLAFYIADCLNPTANIQVGDLQRVPFVIPDIERESIITRLAEQNIELTIDGLKENIIEPYFCASLFSPNKSWLESIKENVIESVIRQAVVLINQAVINEKIFEIYNLSSSDRDLVVDKQSKDVANYPVSRDALQEYVFSTKNELSDVATQYLFSLDVNHQNFAERIQTAIPKIIKGVEIEGICHQYNINPIDLIKALKTLPLTSYSKGKAQRIAFEFLVDMIREILIEDEDGIIPLVPNTGEKVLLAHIEEKFHEKGFSSAQYSSFDSVLGRPIYEYLNKYFFAELSDHLNLFSYLPKTPFIWHLSSGPEQGFDCYIIIYKWSRDKLMRLRSVYLEKREQSLKNRQSDLADNNSAEAQNEKDRIFRQLKEIEDFKKKIDELLAEGYDPILDDGVGKNIAPLQKKKMIPYEVLNAGQLKKYLNADW